MVRSTIQRLGSTTNLPASDRLTISRLIHWQTFFSPSWKFGRRQTSISVSGASPWSQTGSSLSTAWSASSHHHWHGGAVVEMVRFDQESLFDRMAAAGSLTPSLMSELARVIAHFTTRLLPFTSAPARRS